MVIRFFALFKGHLDGTIMKGFFTTVGTDVLRGKDIATFRCLEANVSQMQMLSN